MSQNESPLKILLPQLRVSSTYKTNTRFDDGAVYVTLKCVYHGDKTVYMRCLMFIQLYDNCLVQKAAELTSSKNKDIT